MTAPHPMHASSERDDAAFPIDRAHVFLIAMRMSNHAQHSGYDLICNAIDGEIIETRATTRMPDRVLGRLLRPLVERSGSTWYHRANLLTELAAARRWAVSRHGVFHFLYGENSYRYLGAAKRVTPRRNVIVTTFHTPVWRLRQLVQDTSYIARVDAIIVMSTSQAEFFADLVGPERVHFVPHGIDTQYYSPSTVDRRHGPLRLITVGHHLRDFDVLEAVARRLHEQRVDAEIVIVSRRDQLARFAGIGNVTCRSNLSDDALRALYRSADALLLPLTDATANNALLEGMACGLPVLSTDIQGVRDYVDPRCAALVPKGDAAALCTAIETLLNDEPARRLMGAHSRSAALALDWHKIAAATRQVYRDALNRL